MLHQVLKKKKISKTGIEVLCRVFFLESIIGQMDKPQLHKIEIGGYVIPLKGTMLKDES